MHVHVFSTLHSSSAPTKPIVLMMSMALMEYAAGTNLIRQSKL